MKKLITLLALVLCLNGKAQCYVTIIGNTVVCSGDNDVLTASGASSYTWNTGENTSTINTVPYYSITVYTVTGSVGSCTATNTFTVTVNPLPNVTANTPSVCVGQTTTLTASGAISYTWTVFGDTTPVGFGANIVESPTVTTFYDVSGTDANGCTNGWGSEIIVNPQFSISSNVYPYNNYTNNLESIPVCTGYSDTLYASYATTCTWMPSGITTNSIVVSNVSTIYTLSLNEAGCAATYTVGTNVNPPLPPLTIYPNINPTCVGTANSLEVFGNLANSYTWNPGNITEHCSTNYYSCVSGITISPNITTTYTVIGSSGGCVSPPSVVTVTVNPAPTCSFYIVQDVTPHYWDAYATYSPNVDSVFWYWGDGTQAYGLSPSHTYSVAGTYSICVNAYFNGGCSATYCLNDSLYRVANNSTYSTMVYVNVKNTAGIASLSVGEGQGVRLYPNPNNGSFVIEPDPSLTLPQGKGTLMQVYDVNGRLVLSQTINGKTNIDASSLNEGVYNISITNSLGITNKRLVIVR